MTPHEPTSRRHCPVCRGTGIDPTQHRRFTTGGRDDRTCPRCLGECTVEAAEDEEPEGVESAAEEEQDEAP